MNQCPFHLCTDRSADVLSTAIWPASTSEINQAKQQVKQPERIQSQTPQHSLTSPSLIFLTYFQDLWPVIFLLPHFGWRRAFIFFFIVILSVSVALFLSHSILLDNTPPHLSYSILEYFMIVLHIIFAKVLCTPKTTTVMGIKHKKGLKNKWILLIG